MMRNEDLIEFRLEYENEMKVKSYEYLVMNTNITYFVTGVSKMSDNLQEDNPPSQ